MAFILSGFEHCVADFPYFVVCSGGISLYLKFLCIIAGNSLGSILARILILRKEKETKIEE
jgi:formate/nitrite transporter FocA (FNT family)